MIHKRLPLGPSPLQRSRRSATKKDKMVTEKVAKRCRKEMTPQLDLYSAIKEFNVLSSKELGSLIRDAENGIIKCTINGSSFEITVENLARHLVEHISNEVSSLTVDEQHFRNLLSGLRFLHTLCDISSHHLALARVLAEDISVQKKMLDSIFNLISFLSQFGEKINGSSLMVLYSTLLSNSMYLFKALISSEWKVIADVLLAHPEVDDFIIAAFNAVCVNVNLLQATLTTQRINNCLFHLCESSLQFLLSLCKLQILFRERLVQNKELCGGGAVFRLVENTLKLSQYDDPKLSSVVNRLKSKVLSIMLLLFQAECLSFMDMASTKIKGSAESAVSEKKVLTRVFLQPQREFISTWCTYDHEPAEEEIVVDFNPTSAAGLVLGLNSSFNVQHSTWSNFQAPRTPYRVQRSSLLIKIVANLACYDPDLSEDENACFIDAFLECLQAEFSNLPGGAAERRAAASKNLSSLLAYAESLAPSYLHEEDVNILRWFINQLEKPPTAQESSSRGVMVKVIHI
ncbi:nodulin homeobox-like [Helianthus annuus]|uniref:nodulin homeobox-like n=1 Tax=Helianthus annuus TaxID=4232 RepID=UPI000B903AF2|nr:nodulin homeobox-like [Helianthus annuus]